MANPFYFDETTKARLASLVGWRISPIYPGVVPTDSPNAQPLVQHIQDIILTVREGQVVSSTWKSKERRAKDVFIKCSYMHCPDMRAVFTGVMENAREDCIPFVYPSTRECLKRMDGVPGFVFILHNHNTTATVLPKSTGGIVVPEKSAVTADVQPPPPSSS